MDREEQLQLIEELAVSLGVPVFLYGWETPIIIQIMGSQGVIYEREVKL